MANIKPRWEEDHRPMVAEPEKPKKKRRRRGGRTTNPKKRSRKKVSGAAVLPKVAVYKHSARADAAYNAVKLGKLGAASKVRRIDPVTGEYLP